MGLPMTRRSPPSVSRSARMRARAWSPGMRVVLSHVSSSSRSVADTTYFGMAFIRSANGSPARSGQAAAIVCQVRRPYSSASAPLKRVVEGAADHLRIEERVRPAAVGEAAVRVLVGAAWRLHDTVQAHELDDHDAHGLAPLLALGDTAV